MEDSNNSNREIVWWNVGMFLWYWKDRRLEGFIGIEMMPMHTPKSLEEKSSFNKSRKKRPVGYQQCLRPERRRLGCSQEEGGRDQPTPS